MMNNNSNVFDQIKEEIDKILYCRDKNFPVREAKNTELMRVAIERLSDYLFSKAIRLYNSWTPNSTMLYNANRVKMKPVFICGAMKSGTTMLLRLFDNHKNIIAMPGDSHCYSRFIECKMNFKSIVYYWLARLINPTGQAPFWFLGDTENDYLDFIFYLKYLYDNDFSDNIFTCVVCAAFNKRLSCENSKIVYWVEKTPHNESAYKKLKLVFPNAKFINIIRNPLDNIAALKNLAKFRGNKFDLLHTIKVIKRLINYSLKNRENISDYLLCCYDEIIDEPELKVNSICQFLGIEYDTILMQPTENGAKTKANSMYKNVIVETENIGKIRKYRKDNWLKKLSFIEKFMIINELFEIVFKTRLNLGWQGKNIKHYKINEKVFKLIKPLLLKTII